MEMKWLCQLAMSSLCVFIFVTYSNVSLLNFPPVFTSLLSFPTTPYGKQAVPQKSIVLRAQPSSSPTVPRLAYSISGTKGDLNSLWRTLRAVYHPRNVYVVHLDLGSPEAEREELFSRVKEDTVFAKVENVHVVAQADMVTYRGPTMVAYTLHSCAVLLKRSKDWDWFINLSPSDYPLVTQDGEFILK